VSSPIPPSNAEGQRQLIGHLRHELRTCLTAIIGYTEHLLEELAPDTPIEVAGSLEDLKRGGDAMLSEVNRRLAIDVIDGLLGDALPRVIEELSAGCLAEAERIEATCSGLIKAAERDERFGPIPVLCRIQAAGMILHNILQGYSLEACATGPYASVSAQRGALQLPPLLHRSEAREAERCGGRLLIADDNSVNRDLLRRVLTQKGHEVEEASGGQLALTLIRENDYDVVLLDLIMPDMDGLSVLEALKQEGRLGPTPIMMLSAADEAEQLGRCIESGADDYVVKPFNMVLLNARIRLALELKRHRARERAYLSALEEHRGRAEGASPWPEGGRRAPPEPPKDR
jgi:CheY-like chemotaxis protein